ncbi:MAG: hypothetical protein DRG69_09530, partial [Deltaproteobacteria bacterium]
MVKFSSSRGNLPVDFGKKISKALEKKMDTRAFPVKDLKKELNFLTRSERKVSSMLDFLRTYSHFREVIKDNPVQRIGECLVLKGVVSNQSLAKILNSSD